MPDTATAVVKKLGSKLIDMVASEIEKKDTQTTIKEKIVVPLMNIVFKELNRYVYGLFIIVVLSMVFSLLTFVVSIIVVFSGKNKQVYV